MLSLVPKSEKCDLDNTFETYPPPEELEYEAKCEWIRSVGKLVDWGIFEGPNIGLFENYCIAMGEAKELKKVLDVDGRIVGGKPHPAYKMMLDSMSSARASWDSIKVRKSVSKEEEENEENNWKKDKGLLA